MKKLLIAGLLLAPLLLAAQQVPKNLVASNGVFIGFYEYKPLDYDANPTTKYPVIIFLHGIGERGDGVTNLPLVLAHGIPRNINAGHTMRFFWNGKWETFLVLSPQLSNVYGDWPNFYVDEMLKHAKQNLRIDPDRVFLTGLSLGGGGVWRYASASPANAREFAGIAPVCGTCSIGNACNIANANLPVWAFHAQDDGIVGLGCTTSSILGINNCNPAVKPLMSIYQNGGHGIWGRSYDTEYNYHDPNMYEWFLGQNRSLPANILPVARAGSDQTISGTSTATLNGSGSTDADGNLVRYTWRKISGPAAGTISSPVTANGITTVTGLTTQGTYQYELKVLDNRTSAALDTVIITVSANTNIAPIAKAGNDILITLPTNNTTLNGYASYDPDGTIVSYNWSKISGPSQYAITNQTAVSTTITNLSLGTYNFRLTVTDNNGISASDTVTVTVESNSGNVLNQSPIANAGSDLSITLPTNTVTLNGYNSYDPDGIIVAYNWSKISGPQQFNISNVSDGSTTITNLAQGSYLFRLAVTDESGTTASDSVVITVNNGTVPPSSLHPIANAGSDLSITLPTNSVSLNGYNSYDPDGTIVAFNWSKISGPQQYNITNVSDGSTTVTNLAQGSYLFKLTVTDNSGATAGDTVMVTVNSGTVPPSSLLPIANAGPNFSITLPTNTATLNGYNSYDPDGIIVAYNWSKISGPQPYNITNVSDGSTTVTNLAQGSYLFKLTVTDNSGATAGDTVMITVNNGTVQSPPNSTPPIAKAGSDLSITLPTNTATLNGYNSYDPDGIIVAFNWSKISGPQQFNITNVSDGSTTVTNLAQGSYLFKLLVTDNSGVSAEDTIAITVNSGTVQPPPPNSLPPIAKAGSDLSITLPTNTATLNGYNSYDPDGIIVAFNWSKISGPQQFNITNVSDGSTTVTNLAQGSYLFKLLVTDNSGITTSDTIKVDVGTTTTTSQSSVKENTVSLIENNSVAKITAYPNPAINNITIRYRSNATGQSKMTIYDVTGKVVKQYQFYKGRSDYETPVSVSDLRAGIYFVEITEANHKKVSIKFIKQ